MSDLAPFAFIVLFGLAVFMVALYFIGRMKAEQAKSRQLREKTKKKVTA